MKAVLYRLVIGKITSWLLGVHGGVCTTASEAAVVLGTPLRVAKFLPALIVLKDVELWSPVEVSRQGASEEIIIPLS